MGLSIGEATRLVALVRVPVVALTGISARRKVVFVIEMCLGRQKVAVPRAARCLNTRCDVVPPGPHDVMEGGKSRTEDNNNNYYNRWEEEEV